MNENTSENRVNLDIVRILAAFMVLAVHIGQKVGFNASVGAKGVQLFFVLSGYLICFSIEKYSLKTYIKKRIYRIVPTYWIVLILDYIWDIIRYSRTMPLAEVFAGPCSFRYLRYFFFLQTIIPSDNWNLWNNRYALWTMSSFAVFYIFAPVICKLLNRFWKTLSVLFIFLLATPFVSTWIATVLEGGGYDSAVYFSACNPICNLYCFLFGVCIYYAIKENKSHYYVLLLFVALIVTSGQWYFYEIIFTLLILFMSQNKPIFLSKKCQNVLAYISGMTFTLYLCHPMILEMIAIFNHRTRISNYFYANFFIILCAVILGTCIVDSVIKAIVYTFIQILNDIKNK